MDTITRSAFITALENYDNVLADKIFSNNLAIYTNCLLYEKANNLSDILCFDESNLLDFVATKKEMTSLFFSHQKTRNLREIKEGVAVINYKGIYFFIVKLNGTYINKHGDKVLKFEITNYDFFPFGQLPEIKPNIKKKILKKQCFSIRNIYTGNPDEDYYSHSVSLGILRDMTLHKRCAILALAVIILGSWIIWRNSFPYREMCYDTFAEAVSRPNVRHNFYRRTTSLYVIVTSSDVSRVHFQNRNHGYFISARISESSRGLWLELNDNIPVTWEIGDIVHITGVCVGVIRGPRAPRGVGMRTQTIISSSRNRSAFYYHTNVLHMRVITVRV